MGPSIHLLLVGLALSCASRSPVAVPPSTPVLRAEMRSLHAPLFADEAAALLRAILEAPPVVERASPGVGWVAEAYVGDDHLSITLVRPDDLVGITPPLQRLVATIPELSTPGFAAAAAALRPETWEEGEAHGSVIEGSPVEGAAGLQPIHVTTYRSGELSAQDHRTLDPPEALSTCPVPAGSAAWALLVEHDAGQLVRCELVDGEATDALQDCLCAATTQIVVDGEALRARVSVRTVGSSSHE